MEILNLNDKEKGSIDYDYFVFSGGECHIKINQKIIKNTKIVASLRSSEDVMKLLIATDAIKRNSVGRIELLIPYVPYARQDRACNQGEALSIKVFTDLINAQNYDVVTIFDPHSDVTPALINNCKVQSNHWLVKNVLEAADSTNSALIISPDAGANKKSKDLIKYLGGDLIKCDKTRDTATGKITGFEVYADDLKGKDCVIVDDICDGGGTFIGLAKELKAKNSGDIYLVVSHGIFSKGIPPLIEGGINHVFTTDSFCEIEDLNLTVFHYGR